MAPSRPALYGDQLGLLLLVIAVIGFGAWVIVKSL
jgi:hypothetical protein